MTLECESEITFKRFDIINLPVEKLLSGEMVTMLIVCVALCYMLHSMFYFLNKLYLESHSLGYVGVEPTV